jgi:hypothetical protein
LPALLALPALLGLPALWILFGSHYDRRQYGQDKHEWGKFAHQTHVGRSSFKALKFLRSNGSFR